MQEAPSPDLLGTALHYGSRINGLKLSTYMSMQNIERLRRAAILNEKVFIS